MRLPIVLLPIFLLIASLAHAQQYDIEHPPPNDNKWCNKNARSATQLDRCWRRQHHETMPEDYPALPPSAPAPYYGQSKMCRAWVESQHQYVTTFCSSSIWSH